MISSLRSISLKLFLLLFTFFLSNECFAIDPPDTLWTRTYGGTNIDYGYSVAQTADGGFIMTGYTRSYGLAGHNIWLVKTDAFGTKQWDNAFGGTGDDEAYSVQQTSDHGYIVTGFTNSYGAGQKDVVLLKADSLGNLVFQKMFGGQYDEEGYSVQQTSDGGFIVAGATSSFGTAGSRDVWLIKTDNMGNDTWKKNYGGYGSDGARCVQQTSDGGYIITGWTYSSPANTSVGSCWLLKVDAQGNQQWNKIFGGTDVDRGFSVQQTTDGGYIVTGYTSSYGAGLDDMQLIKTDASGNLQWRKYFGGTGRDYGNEVHQTSDGGFIITGSTLSYSSSEDAWLIKTDSAGVQQWMKTYGGTSTDVANSVKQTTDGGYAVFGYTLSYGAGVHDFWLVRVGSSLPVELVTFTGNMVNGNVSLTWTTSTENNNKGFEVDRRAVNKDNSVSSWESLGFVNGKGTTTIKQQYSFIDNTAKSGSYEYRLKQQDYSGASQYSGTVEVNVETPKEFSVKQNYPNPFNPSTTIEYSVPESSPVMIKVFDVLGKEVQTLVNEVKPAGTYQLQWKADNFSGGVYFYQVTAGNYSKTTKMLLIK